jgi:hypothetical protein
MAEFIFMLTNQDRTVANAREAMRVALDAGVRHVGFKDVGATPELQRELAQMARNAGATSHLEVVAVTAEDELASVSAGIAAGVDWILGGKNAAPAVALLRGTGINYAPFCGRTVGHPSVLEGEIAEIADDAAALCALDGVTGVDVLAYRHKTADVPALIRATVERSSGPVIVAGGITSAAQVDVVDEAGAWGFTIGSAIFENQLDAEPGLESQIRAALQYASGTK